MDISHKFKQMKLQICTAYPILMKSIPVIKIILAMPQSRNTIEHVKYFTRAMKEMRRILKKGRKLTIATPL